MGRRSRSARRSRRAPGALVRATGAALHRLRGALTRRQALAREDRVRERVRLRVREVWTKELEGVYEGEELRREVEFRESNTYVAGLIRGEAKIRRSHEYDSTHKGRARAGYHWSHASRRWESDATISRRLRIKGYWREVNALRETGLSLRDARAYVGAELRRPPGKPLGVYERFEPRSGYQERRRAARAAFLYRLSRAESKRARDAAILAAARDPARQRFKRKGVKRGPIRSRRRA